jgi:hypothetical protein
MGQFSVQLPDQPGVQINIQSLNCRKEPDLDTLFISLYSYEY